MFSKEKETETLVLFEHFKTHNLKDRIISMDLLDSIFFTDNGKVFKVYNSEQREIAIYKTLKDRKVATDYSSPKDAIIREGYGYWLAPYDAIQWTYYIGSETYYVYREK